MRLRQTCLPANYFLISQLRNFISRKRRSIAAVQLCRLTLQAFFLGKLKMTSRITISPIANQSLAKLKPGQKNIHKNPDNLMTEKSCEMWDIPSGPRQITESHKGVSTTAAYWNPPVISNDYRRDRERFFQTELTERSIISGPRGHIKFYNFVYIWSE